MDAYKAELLFEQLKKIRGISKQLIEKTLIINKNKTIDTINTISNITGLTIKIRKNRNSKINLKVFRSSESEETDSDNDSGECTCGSCYDINKQIETINALRKNKTFLEFRDNLVQREPEEINLLIKENYLEIRSFETFKTMIDNPGETLQLLSETKLKE